MKVAFACGCAMAFGILISKSTEPVRTQPFSKMEQASDLLSGARVTLPAKDYFGRSLPKGPWQGRVILTRGCPACSTEKAELLKLEGAREPVVYFFDRQFELSEIDTKAVPKNVFLVWDDGDSVLPPAAYRLAGFQFEVDRNGFVLGVQPFSTLGARKRKL